MISLLVGFIMGAAFTACGFIILVTREPRQEPDPWTEDHYRQAPPAGTRISINRKRDIEI
jgi:hypothetical protein